MRITINGVDCEHFTGVSINRKLDSIASTFSFTARFNPENDQHKELFKPLQYHEVKIWNDQKQLVLTGYILNHKFMSDSKNNLVAVSGYSKCGILEDVRIDPKYYPLEANNSSLRDILEKICKPYGIGFIIDPSVKNGVSRSFEKVVAQPTDTAKGFLSKLTSQRNIVLSHNEKGEIVLFKPDTNQRPVKNLNKDNTLVMESNWNGQGLHSHISVVRQPSKDNAGASTVDSVKNPLINRYRPTTKILSSGEDTDTSKAANNELAAELKNIGISAKLYGIHWDIKPGVLIEIHNHEIYSFAYSRWFVDEVVYNQSEKEQTTDIKLVLPETYNGNVPKPILFYYQTHQRHG